MLPIWFMLIGCDAPLSALPFDQVGPPPALEVRGVVVSEPVQVVLRTGIARAQVRLLRSPYVPQPGPCPPALGGACLGIVGFETVADVVASAGGVATFTFPANAAVDTSLTLQALVRTPRGARVTAPVMYRVLSDNGDADLDTLSNALELTLGMNPYVVDSDGGGTIDPQERADGTNGADPLDDRPFEANCTDRLDGDGDGGVDCGDADCGCLERCDLNGDEDRDGLTSCFDPDCIGHPACAEQCRGGLDEDNDRRTDCFDDDCAASPLCERGCGDGLDDDADGRIDCSDADCAGLAACALSGERCTDGIDNDADGRIDCADTGCNTAQVCREQCDNGVDELGDGLIDCADPACADNATRCLEDCRNNADDDLDGLADCADDDCAFACREVCGDGADNDGDGLADCADDGCGSACAETCDDGSDNDGDDRVDCEDTECAATCQELCFDRIDNDADGLTDCVDSDCVGRCVEVCGNRRDDDLDGRTDCEDDGCACVEQCTNGEDDDLDGLADCADPECAGRCGEDCTNGADDDRDGLVDCEDGGCTDLCAETCGNGADDDGDLWVDCQDDECWSDPACPADKEIAWVVHGSLSTRKYDLDGRFPSWGWCDAQHIDGTSGAATGVTGFLSVSHSGRAARCAWQVERAEFEHRREASTYLAAWFTTTALGGYQTSTGCRTSNDESFTLRRTGFSVQPGCGTTGSDFLPDRLLPSADDVNLVGGTAWYGGGNVRRTPVPQPTWYSSSAPGTWTRRSTAYTNGPLRPVGAHGTCATGDPALAPAVIVGGLGGVCVP